MNIFSAITSGLQGYDAFKGLTETSQAQALGSAIGQSKLGQQVSPIAQNINRNVVTPIKKATAPIADTFYSATAKPVVKEYQFQKATSNYYKPYREEIQKLGITQDDLNELPDEEKQQVMSQLQKIGVDLSGGEAEKPLQEDLGVLGSLKEGAIGASRVGQYLPEIAGNIGGMVPGLLGEGAGLVGSAFGVEKKDNPVYQSLKAGQKATENIGRSIVVPGEVGLNEGQKSARRSGATTALTLPVGGGYLKGAKGVLDAGLKGAIVGTGIGASQPILEKGSKVTSEDIGQGAVYGGLAGGLTPLLGGGTYKAGKWAVNKVRPKTIDEKLMKTVGDVTDAVVNGKKVKVPVPEEGILTKISKPLRESNPKILTGRALTPSYAGKTPKQKVKALGEMTDNVKNFYSQVRTGKMKGDISTLENAANTVINNLDDIGENIGKSVAKAEGTVRPSVGTMENISKTLTNKIEARSGAYKPLQNFLDDTKNPLSLQDAFKAKKVYQAEIGKLIKAGDSGTDSYSSLVKGVQELSDNIDTIVEKSIGSKKFLELKKQYKLLKTIASDISSSAVVEGRRAPQTFVEQLGTLQAITELSTSPLSTARTLFAKEIGEMNTRGGAWKELIKNYDKEAIKLFKK